MEWHARQQDQLWQSNQYDSHLYEHRVHILDVIPVGIASAGEDAATSSLWFCNEAVKHRVETNSLMPPQALSVNSLDVCGRSVIIGGDNEAFYIFNNVFL